MHKFGAFIKKSRVVFIPFDDNKIPFSQTVIAAEILENATDHKGGIAACVKQHPCRQSCGGCFSVGAGNKYGFFIMGHESI